MITKWYLEKQLKDAEEWVLMWADRATGALRERDEAISERDDATEHGNLIQAAHDEAIRERNQARAERDELRRQRDEAREGNQARAERNELRRQRDEARKFADELSSANATLRAQVRAWQTEHDECDADSRIVVLNHVQTSLHNLVSYMERTK